jgi:uncharacterized membrane protein
LWAGLQVVLSLICYLLSRKYLWMALNFANIVSVISTVTAQESRYYSNIILDVFDGYFL